METKNEIIAKYLKERFSETQRDYPGIFSYEKYERAVIMFKDNTSDIDDLKLLIDEMIEKEIYIYIQRKEDDKRVDLLLNQYDIKDSEFRTYKQLKKIYDKIKKIVDNAGLELYISGGIVPYLLLNQKSERLHDDIDNICKLDDISKFRKLFKQVGLYDEKLDSLSFAKDKQDYGFEFEIEGVTVGIYPFSYFDGVLTQYTYTSSSRICKEKMIPLNDINDYIFTYKGLDGNIYNTQSLEMIKKTKDLLGREKDKIDSIKISEYGIRQDVYDRLPVPIEIQNKPASELKPVNDKKKEFRLKSQLAIAFANAQNNQKQQVS